MIRKYFTERPGATETSWLCDSSSFIQAIKYDKLSSKLYVKIAGNTYDYGISLDLADEFSLSSSWGRFYNERIKQHEAKAKERVIHTLRIKKPEHKSVSKSTKIANQDIKDVLGYVWGTVDVALMFAEPAVWIPSRIAMFMAQPAIEKWGIIEPFGLQVAAVISGGFNIKSELKGPASRLASYMSSVKTPYFNIGLKKGILSGSMTWDQITAGIVFGGKKWQMALTNIEKRKVAMEFLESYRIPGTDTFKITDEEISMIKNFSEFNVSRRKLGASEKVLDFTIKHANKLPSAIAAGYMVAGEYERYNVYKEYKNPKKKKKNGSISKVTENGIDVATTIMKIGTKV